MRCTDLVLFGVIAEPETLSLDEKVAIIRIVRRAVPTARVTAGVLGTSAREPLHEVEVLAAELSPGDRVMADIVHDDVERQRVRLDAFREASGGRDVVLQDYARASGVRMRIDGLVELLTATPYVVAVKEETSPTFDRIRRLAAIPGLEVVGGLGGANLVDDMLAGAHGLALGISTPERLIQAVWRWRDGDRVGAVDEVARVAGLISFETQPGRSVGIRKEHWRRRGVIATANVRRPGESWTSELESHSTLHLAAALGTGRR
jgi:4-hydroxy-tetrahydrodipicolinate synthase